MSGDTHHGISHNPSPDSCIKKQSLESTLLYFRETLVIYANN